MLYHDKGDSRESDICSMNNVKIFLNSISNENINNNESLILSRMNYLRGLFAILVVLGHCSMCFETEPLALLIIHKANYLWVCFFLYVCGWSLAHNYEYRNNYLEGFIKNKVIKLLMLGVEVEIIGNILRWIFLKESWNIDLNLLIGWDWYIYECLIIYILYYVAYKHISSEKMILGFLWITSFLIAVMFWALYKWGAWEGWTFAYYYSTMSFPLGISQHYIFKKSRYTKNSIWIASIMAMIVSIVSLICVILPQDSFTGGVVFHNLLGCGFLILFTFMLFLSDVKKIRCIRFLTRYAPNIYFYHFCVIEIVATIYKREEKNIDECFVLIILLITVCLSIGVDKLNTFILCQKRRGRK